MEDITVTVIKLQTSMIVHKKVQWKLHEHTVPIIFSNKEEGQNNCPRCTSPNVCSTVVKPNNSKSFIC